MRLEPYLKLTHLHPAEPLAASLAPATTARRAFLARLRVSPGSTKSSYPMCPKFSMSCTIARWHYVINRMQRTTHLYAICH